MTLLEFIFKNEDIIKKKNFLDLYKNILEEYYIGKNQLHPQMLTKFFLDLNIDPLDYTDGVVPNGCFYEYDFKESDHILPPQITLIGNSSYAYSSGLKRFFAPPGFKEIGSFAFMQCQDLKHIYLPSSVDNIPQGTFLNEGLTELTIHTPMNSVAWRYAEKNHITRDNLYRYPGKKANVKY